MVKVDQTELDRVSLDRTQPADVVDRLLWRDAQAMLDQHAAPGPDGTCLWCGWQWPCAPRRLAERADTASRRPWREAWTVRHDLNSIREMPGLRVGLGDNRDRHGQTSPARRAWRRSNQRAASRGGTNRGSFE